MSQNTSITSLKYMASSTRAGGFLLLVVAGLVVVVVVVILFLVVLVAGLAVFFLALLTRLVLRVRALALVHELVPGGLQEAFVFVGVVGGCSIRAWRVSAVLVSILYTILLFCSNIG